MKIKYVSRKCTARNDLKEYTEKKLSKLNKFFSDSSEATVVYTPEKDGKFKVEVTAENEGIIFRAQSVKDDFKYCIDDISEILVRQIRKHKTKLEKQFKHAIDPIFSAEPAEEEEFEIIKKKSVKPKPMTEEEALLQMNMLGHDFFIFKDEDGNSKIIYRRHDKKYGLIEIE